MEQYNRVEKLGEGTYGVVYKGKHKITGHVVAIKRVKLESEDEGVPSTTIREISLLKELVHPNIVKLEDVIMEEFKVCLIFEFMTMDLKKYLESLGPGNYLNQKMLKAFMYQMTLAILFCHKRRVLHRDLKPQNILVDAKGTLKLADFGLGRAIGVPVRVFTHEIVTLWYRAPEVLLGCTKYSCPVDMWAIGCIFAEMTSKRPLFPGDSEIDQLFRIFRILKTPTEDIWPGVTRLPDYKPTFPNWDKFNLFNHVKNLDADGLDLLKKLLVYDPCERMSAKETLTHQYFKNLDKTTLPTTYS